MVWLANTKILTGSHKGCPRSRQHRVVGGGREGRCRGGGGRAPPGVCGHDSSPGYPHYRIAAIGAGQHCMDREFQLKASASHRRRTPTSGRRAHPLGSGGSGGRRIFCASGGACQSAPRRCGGPRCGAHPQWSRRGRIVPSRCCRLCATPHGRSPHAIRSAPYAGRASRRTSAGQRPGPPRLDRPSAGDRAGLDRDRPQVLTAPSLGMGRRGVGILGSALRVRERSAGSRSLLRRMLGALPGQRGGR